MIKKIIFVVFCTVIVILCGCKANYPVAQESGKEDVAYLIFVSSSDSKSKNVNVSVDNGEPFQARTVKARKANRRGTQYTVQTGKRKVKVSCDGRVLYDKYVFLSPQETKKITLP